MTEISCSTALGKKIKRSRRAYLSLVSSEGRVGRRVSLAEGEFVVFSRQGEASEQKQCQQSFRVAERL